MFRLVLRDVGAFVGDVEPGLDNLAFDSRGRLFVSNANTGAIYEVRADGTVRTVSPGGFINVVGLPVLPRAGGESAYLASVFSIAELDGATGQQRRFDGWRLFTVADALLAREPAV